MTTEVIVMNKMAVAMAADSAVAITGGKIYNTGNKLFTLSKYQPVGIMVYGSAQLMEVPWESIIKLYRNGIGNNRFDKISLYGEDFIDYLKKFTFLYSDEQQSRYVHDAVIDICSQIMDIIKELYDEVLEFKGKINEKQIIQICSDVVEDISNNLNSSQNLCDIPVRHYDDILIKYIDIIDQAKKDIFKDLPITKDTENKLLNICCNIFCKDVFSNRSSGIVIAGFGESEIFPGVIEYKIEGFANNILKYKIKGAENIEFNSRSYIGAFAQGDMVHTFMEGVDPGYNSLVKDELQGLAMDLAEKWIKTTKIKNKEKALEKLEEISDEMLADINSALYSFRDTNYVKPVTTAVSILPKEELALMAESLVSLTSLKRKVSIDQETVGGPVDVAVISKGDGFVWIKHKHYFDIKLNQNFYNNYLNK